MIKEVESDLLGKFCEIGEDAWVIFGYFSEMFADSLAHLFCIFAPETTPF